jgi:hypothetical protein
MNEEVCNYSHVPKRHFIMAKKWFNALKPSTDTRGEYAKAYHQWRDWNWKRNRDYKGNVIMDKATGQPASSSSANDEHEEEERGDEIEEERSKRIARKRRWRRRWLGRALSRGGVGLG